jgi:predicted nucleic acid-binding protein
MPRAGKRIVLDASVARCAGSGSIPGRRRAVFSAVEARHSVVFSEECLAEWKEHEGDFARGWRARMVARRRVLFLESCLDERLREKLAEAATSQTRRRAIVKDAHLLEAAREADRIVVSLDEEARGLFRDAAVHVTEIRSVTWANPENHEEGVVDWLHGGARRDHARELGAPR